MADHSRLGRGLASLIGDVGEETSIPEQGRRPRRAPVENLKPNPRNPRRSYTETELTELADSIRERGIIQPIVVRSARDSDDMYEIIAGERRWRASQIAGLTSVPVLIREIPDDAALAMSLIENIQRENLNPLEEAAGLQRLIDEFGMTHQQAADAVGRSRPAATNLLRLLQLAKPAQDMLMAGDIEMGHARALLALAKAEQGRVAAMVVEKGYSVRETERMVAHELNPPAKKSGAAKARDRDLLRLEEELSDGLGATVKIAANRKGAGVLSIRFSSLDQLDGLLAKLR